MAGYIVVKGNRVLGAGSTPQHAQQWCSALRGMTIPVVPADSPSVKDGQLRIVPAENDVIHVVRNMGEPVWIAKNGVAVLLVEANNVQ